MPLISGVNIALGGQDYIIPPLNFAALKRLQSTIETLSNISANMTESQIDAVADIVFAAMLRNYPNTKKEDVLDWLDLGNAGTILSAIMGQSGVKSVGEQKAGATSP